MKKVIGWLHLWLGIASGLVVLVVAVSGSLLVFEDELEHTFRHSFYYVAVPADGSRASVDALAEKVQQRYEGYQLSSITVEPEPDRTMIFFVKKGNDKLLAIAVNPYTGEIIKAVDYRKQFFTVVLQLHRYLCMGTVGKTITGVSCSIFVILVLTGLVLWWPKRNNRRQRFRVKWNASGKRLNWDLHVVFGFYVHVTLFLIGLTGLVWSYQWVDNLVFYIFDGKAVSRKMKAPESLPDRSNRIAYLDRILARTNQELPHPGTVTIRFPEKDSLAISAAKLNTTASISNVVDFLYFRAGSGELVKKRLYATESRGTKARRLFYPIHTGSIYGWPTKIVALISSIVAASLPITGLLIWLNRKKKKPVAKKKRPGSQLHQHADPGIQYQ